VIPVVVIVGTRPEAIKLAPVIHALERSTSLRPVVVATGQHADLAPAVLDAAGISVAWPLNIMRPDQTPDDVAAAILTALPPVLAAERPAWVIVQGDTTTAMAAALASYHAGIRVAHVEAGLRTHDRRHPMPEEVNRRVVSLIADAHFVPTARAAQNLLDEGLSPESIFLTGNTGVDALYDAIERAGSIPASALAPGADRLVLVTAHRRESHSRGLR
jgi:UDP-N-acetylglucosamine 2-epimerase (non-hydrolysing)